MKKIIAMLVCVLMLAACLPTAAFAVDAGITTGDVNGDEAVDVKDVVLMIRFLTGWDVGISEEYGDFDGNGRIDMRDLILLIRYILSSTPEPEPKPEPDPAPSQIGEVLALVNAERAKHGLAALTEDWELSRVARYKSQDMHDNRYFAHNSPTYGTPFRMLRAFGLSYRTAGENIAMGYAAPAAVVAGWMNSEGHRANILSSAYTKIGVGYVADGHYWTQQFIG